MLAKVVNANDDIIAFQGDLRQSIDSVVSNVRTLERDAMLSAKLELRLSNDWFKNIRSQFEELDAMVSQAAGIETATKLPDVSGQVVSDAQAQIATSQAVFQKLADIGDQSETLRDTMVVMTRLEERLKGIIETCGSLVHRLQPENSKPDS